MSAAAVGLGCDSCRLSRSIVAANSLADFFVQGGQVAGTMAWQGKEPRASGDSQVTVYASAAVKADIDVWSMGCGWLTPSYTENPTI